MPKCQKCGTTINEGQKFCTKCGTKIEEKKGKNLSAEILAKIDIIQKKISNDNLNTSLYVELGDVYFENEMFEEAILEYQKAFSIDNKNFDSVFKTAETYRKINEFLKAETLYLNAIELNPKSQEAKLGLFWSFYNQHKYDEAIKLKTEINEKNQKLNFHIAMKEAFKKNENKELAYNEMELIYQLDSENVDNLRDLADHYSDEDNEKSIEFYNKILSINPNYIESIFVIGKDFCYKKNYKKTIELFEKNLTNFPDELLSITYIYLSYSFIMLNNFDRAIELISDINISNIRLNSEKDKEIFVKTLFGLSENCVKRNNFNAAIIYLENAIKFEPENQTIIDRLSSIKEIKKIYQKKIKKKKLRNINLSVIAIILISISIFAVIKYVNTRKDNLAWENALSKNTIRSYENYIIEYPNGKHIDKAHIQKDNKAWELAKIDNSKKSFEYYIDNYPKGFFIIAAKSKLIELERAYIDSLKNSNFSLTSFLKYRLKYPNGEYRNDVKKLLLDNYFVLVKGGSMEMAKGDPKKLYTPKINDYYIGKYEITQEEYAYFIKDQTGKFEVRESLKNHPVSVSWESTNAFCKWIGARLPTEAEWEFAARGGNKSKGYKYSGSNYLEKVAWYYGRTTHPVGQKLPNELGLYDMSGNVREWCSGNKINYHHIYRGGSYQSLSEFCLVDSRKVLDERFSYVALGFRIVFDVK